LEVTEGLRFALQKDSNDGLGGVTTLKLHGEGMFGQCDVRVFLISPQCRVEKRLKVSGTCLVSHLTSREEMGSLEGGLVGYEEMVGRRQDVVGRGFGAKVSTQPPGPD
jgi:hypothetical protein